MPYKNAFEVNQPIDAVWKFLGDIPQVAKCLPGAELSEQVGDDKYVGGVLVRLGPVKMQFAGSADITERNETAKRVVVKIGSSSLVGKDHLQAYRLQTNGPRLQDVAYLHFHLIAP